MKRVKLQLLNLRCYRTEDVIGPDEPYITINGQRVWSGVMENGESRDLSKVAPVEFLGMAQITLFDEDMGFFDSDDFLGSAFAFENLAGLGPYRVTFDGDGAAYELTFEVVSSSAGDDKPEISSAAGPVPSPPVPEFTREIFKKAETLSGIPIVANRHTLELHRVNCVFASKIDLKNRYPQKGSMDGANAPGYILDGYDGCYYCLPQIHFK